MHKSMVARAGGGGVSDMDMFYLFREKQSTMTGSFPEIFGRSPIDLTLSETNGYKDDGRGFKRLVWNGRRPSAILFNEQLIPLSALHHQGKAKSLIKLHYSKISKCLLVFSSLLCFSLNIFFKVVNKIVGPEKNIN